MSYFCARKLKVANGPSANVNGDGEVGDVISICRTRIVEMGELVKGQEQNSHRL